MANISFGQNILPKTDNTYSLGNSSYKWHAYLADINGQAIEDLVLPAVTSTDNGKILKVSSGVWTVGDAPSGLPSVSSTDNGKILGVNEGSWSVITPDDTTWNGVKLNKLATTGSSDIYVISNDSTSMTSKSYLTKATKTPTANTISKYDTNAYLNSTTPSSGDSSTKVATTAFVDTYFAPKADPVFTGSISMGRTGTTGTSSIAIGTSAKASGQNSFAAGAYANATGNYSFAMGYTVNAKALHAYAQGYNIQASGAFSHAYGRSASANASHSFAMGSCNQEFILWPIWTANTSYQVGDRVRQYDGDSNGYICQVANSDSSFTSENWTEVHRNSDFAYVFGNGTDQVRSNAYALEWSGTGRYGGNLYVNCNTDSTGGNKVATESYVTTAIANASIGGDGSSVTLATVATTGDYDDLINKPDLSSYLTSVPTMVGATSDEAGTAGLVPAPAADAQYYLKFLCSNGTWSTVNAASWSGMSASPSDSLTSLTSAQVLARRNSVYTTIKFLSANATPTAYNLAMYDANAYLNSTTTSSTDNSTKVATTAFVKSVLPSTMTGATSSVAGASGLVPAPTSADVDKFLAGDGTYKSGGLPMVILSYGHSTWAEFEAAYNNNVIVYTRASSNSNPASGSQTRMAFMAYVNNATTPTEVEFQYYRSMSSHSATAMGDQVFVYKLAKSGGWSVTTRDASIKQIKVDTNDPGTVSWSGNVVTIKSGLPKVTASDNGKILKVVNGAWAAVSPE